MNERMSSERVAAVVVTYNRKALLRQCLTALEAQTHPLETIIVVDNASTDGTAEMLNAQFPAVEMLVLPENRGGAGGFHAGMAAALNRAVDWVWVMDDDVEPTPSALERLFAPGLHHRSDTVALASMRINPDGTLQVGSAGWYAPFRMRYEHVSASGRRWEPIGYATFVGLLVRRRVISDLGLPKEGYFIHADDNEYVLRLARAGRVYLVRASRVVHHDAAARKAVPSLRTRMRSSRPVSAYWREYYMLRNKLLIVRDHADTLGNQWLGYLSGIRHLMRKIVGVLAFDNYKILRTKILLRAFWDGLRGRDGKRVDPVQFAKFESDAESNARRSRFSDESK